MPFGKKPAPAAPPPKPGVLRLFSIDLHQAVIADIKDVLHRLFGDKVEVKCHRAPPLAQSQQYADDIFLFHNSLKKVHDWNVTGYGDPAQFGFKSPWRVHDGDRHENIINSDSWYALDSEMVSNFLWKYSPELKKYDGFIVSHSPVLCRLYEAFEKPVILVNSCRYDQPYCWNGNLEQLAELHACLRRLLEKQLLVSISNNKADQEYLKLGAGIDSHHVPSLCMYTNVEWEKDKAQEVGACLGFRHSSEEGAGKPTALGSLLEQKVPALVPRPRAGIAKSEHHGVVRTTAGHTWQDLYQRKALVHLPYEMSTMSLFEQYSAGVPLIFPTKRFYVELIKAGIIKACHFWKGRWGKHLKLPWNQLPQHARDFWSRFPHARASEDTTFIEMGDPARQMPPQLLPTLQLEFWVDNADFYDTDNMPGLFYFDSWEELQTILTDGRLADIPASRLPQARQERLQKILDSWRPLLIDKFPALGD